MSNQEMMTINEVAEYLKIAKKTALCKPASASIGLKANNIKPY
ncbi:MAG: hypothetical protein ACJARD_001574 [Alphaproteobacteria bacterium]|jgi:hypothetical protein